MLTVSRRAVFVSNMFQKMNYMAAVFVYPSEQSWRRAVWSSELWEKWFTKSPKLCAIGRKRGEIVIPVSVIQISYTSPANHRTLYLPENPPLFYLGFRAYRWEGDCRFLPLKSPFLQSLLILCFHCHTFSFGSLTFLLVFRFSIKISAYLFHVLWTCPVLNHVDFSL